MNMLKPALLGAAALVGGFAIAHAQSAPEIRAVRVPAGVVLLVAPAGAQAVAPRANLSPVFVGPAFPAAPALSESPVLFGSMNPGSMMRQMDQMMARMQQVFARQDAMMSNPRMVTSFAHGMPGVSEVTVTSVSNGHGTCTQSVTYDGRGKPVVHVSATGNACAMLHVPGTTSVRQAVPPHVFPLARTTLASRASPAPMQIAELSR